MTLSKGCMVEHVSGLLGYVNYIDSGTVGIVYLNEGYDNFDKYWTLTLNFNWTLYTDVFCE